MRHRATETRERHLLTTSLQPHKMSLVDADLWRKQGRRRSSLLSAGRERRWPAPPLGAGPVTPAQTARSGRATSTRGHVTSRTERPERKGPSSPAAGSAHHYPKSKPTVWKRYPNAASTWSHRPEACATARSPFSPVPPRQPIPAPRPPADNGRLWRPIHRAAPCLTSPCRPAKQ